MNKYESHITLIKPENDDEFNKLVDIAEKIGMKSSWITGDPILGPGKYFYISGYSDNFDILYTKVKEASQKLVDAQFKVIREKIEQIMYDTKTGHFQCGVDCFACLDT